MGGDLIGPRPLPPATRHCYSAYWVDYQVGDYMLTLISLFQSLPILIGSCRMGLGLYQGQQNIVPLFMVVLNSHCFFSGVLKRMGESVIKMGNTRETRANKLISIALDDYDK